MASLTYASFALSTADMGFDSSSACAAAAAAAIGSCFCRCARAERPRRGLIGNKLSRSSMVKLSISGAFCCCLPKLDDADRDDRDAADLLLRGDFSTGSGANPSARATAFLSTSTAAHTLRVFALHSADFCKS